MAQERTFPTGPGPLVHGGGTGGPWPQPPGEVLEWTHENKQGSGGWRLRALLTHKLMINMVEKEGKSAQKKMGVNQSRTDSGPGG